MSDAPAPAPRLAGAAADVAVIVMPPTGSAAAVPKLRIWDPLVRALHWTLVVSVALAALGLVAWFGVHRPAGYVAAAVVGLRVVWGFVGPRSARWRGFVRSPRATCTYARAVLAGRAPRHLGHNPLGGWMALALCATVLGLALTGWLYTTDAFWGDETVEAWHVALAWALLGLVALHLAGVLATSWAHRENLVAAMLHGRKRAPGPDDIV